MKEKNALLKELVDEWGAYIESDRALTLVDFSQWLYEKQEQPKEITLPESVEQEIRQESLDNTVARHFGMLNQFSALWVKITFKESPFIGFEDYGITQYIFHAGNPTKSMVADRSLLERSTAFEIIRRMQKLGLVEEFPDSKDKRTKRVAITEQGKVALQQADHRVNQVSKLLMGNLTEKKKMDLLQLLIDLNKFHLKEYEKGREEVEQSWFEK